MTATLIARPATLQDAPAMTEIYNEGIADRIATFEINPRAVEDVAAWFAADRPIVVVVDTDGEIAGYAATFAYADRCCYAGIAEFSVYVRRSHRGQGVGALAMTALVRACGEAGYWKLLSRVFVENAASLALLQSVGFKRVGIHEKHGKLDGVWRDVVAVERLIEGNL